MSIINRKNYCYHFNNTQISGMILTSRRGFLIGAGVVALSGCGGSGGSSTSSPPVQLPSENENNPTPSATPTPSTAVLISEFHTAGDGINLQPAIQKALDAAADRKIGKVIYDLEVKEAELWCPIRSSDFKSRASDGVPIVIKTSVHLDFSGAFFKLKGPGGVDRMPGQVVAGSKQPWLGGFIYVIGNKNFDKVVIENVTADGGFDGPIDSNRASNLSDKGFRIQDTDVKEVYLKNVELRNFGGEIYYIGGWGPEYQLIENCHFHGSPQCAFNPGGVGKLDAVNLRAGRAYQAAEVIGGRGHHYNQCEFYDSLVAGCSFFGGPSPGFRSGYPYWFAYWDGVGLPPYVEFEGTLFNNCGSVRLGAWMKGTIRTLDTTIGFMYDVGHLRDIDLKIDSICSAKTNFEAVSLRGPDNDNVAIRGAPQGTTIEPPSEITLKITCSRSDNPVDPRSVHQAALRFYGGLVKTESISITASGTARKAKELFGEGKNYPAPNVVERDFTVIT